jgi:branched-chain amino acid aminotransferase
LECFGAGTAVLVSAVNNIEYKGRNYPVPFDKVLNIGVISNKIRQKLLDIQEGRSPDKYGWITKVK